MAIYDALKNKKTEDTDGINNKLLVLAEDIVKEAEKHLTLIKSQLPDFDSHDKSHSEAVLKNMDELMTDEIINNLSGYELFLLYLSAYLHDCAMALPEWENNLLKMTEGIEELDCLELTNSLKRDFKAPFKFSEAIQIIKDKKSDLYGDFEERKDFIFINKDEELFIQDLAKRLIEYQEFRNGYTEEFKKLLDNGDKNKYLDYSNFIRQIFIRNTHPQRAEIFIKNLKEKFANRLGGSWGKQLAEDLAKISRAHGEDFSFVTGNLEEQASYFGTETANLQFIAIMLRLADIIHFSYDRVSKSLFAEQMIDSPESVKHWKVKFQGVNYTLKELDESARSKIKFMAFCEEPGLYYFIHEYMDWIDNELTNYFKFLHNMQYKKNKEKLAEKYKLAIADNVDRTQIKYDAEKFTPVSNIGFTLNQRGIIELLMGVRFYKDKYLCLRELYQNALDACRCMAGIYSNDGVSKKGYIEFGLGEEVIERKKRKFIYCSDNGTGMTKDIIENYFLKIGNSYYTSREFYRKIVKLRNPFKPISCFGIGILSCFMIGDKIEVITKAIKDEYRSYDVIKFSVDGPYERFYYMKPDELDIEKIGSHGTLIKIYLKSEEADLINDEDFDPVVFHLGEHSNDFSRKNDCDKWSHNLYKFIWNIIGIVDERVEVCIKLAHNNKKTLIPWHSRYSCLYSGEIIERDIEEILCENSDNGCIIYLEYIKYKKFIKTELCIVSCGDISYYFLLNLPSKGIPVKYCRPLEFIDLLFDNRDSYKLLVDGIYIKFVPKSFSDYLNEKDILENGIINFKTAENLKLSVDRNEISDFDDNIKKSLEELPGQICINIIEKIKYHILENSFTSDSYEMQMIWEYLFTKFASMAPIFISYLVKETAINICLKDLSEIVGKDITKNELVDSTEFTLRGGDYRTLSISSKLLLFVKLFDADTIEVHDKNINISSKKLVPMDFFLSDIRTYMTIIIRTDIWEGIYSKYDMVSALWPFIPERLFNKILHNMKKDITNRSALLFTSRNTLGGVGELDPVLIHPKMGIYGYNNTSWNTFTLGEKNKNLIGKFDNRIGDFWLFEINQPEVEDKQKHRYFLYTFISPRKLTNKEEDELERNYKIQEPEYYEGVKNGWSILFYGDIDCKVTIISPGIVDREELLKKIEKEFWEEHKEEKFYFLDGTPVNITDYNSTMGKNIEKIIEESPSAT